MTLAHGRTIAFPPSRTLSFAPSGAIYDVANPCARPIDFAHVAMRLARTYRFNATAGALSVLQHQVMGAEAIIAEGGTALDAALFLHHDDHEFILGDMVSPVSATIKLVLPGFASAWSDIKANWDGALYAALGLPGPDRWTETQATLVKSMDMRMQAVESRALFGARGMDQFTPQQRRTPRLKTGLDKVWPPERAAELWFDAHRKFTGRNLR